MVYLALHSYQAPVSSEKVAQTTVIIPENSMHMYEEMATPCLFVSNGNKRGFSYKAVGVIEALALASWMVYTIHFSLNNISVQCFFVFCEMFCFYSVNSIRYTYVCICNYQST